MTVLCSFSFSRLLSRFAVLRVQLVEWSASCDRAAGYSRRADGADDAASSAPVATARRAIETDAIAKIHAVTEVHPVRNASEDWSEGYPFRK